MDIRITNPDLLARLKRQVEAAPSIYANIDVAKMPERFTTGDDGERIRGLEAVAQSVLEDPVLMEKMAAYTLTGDAVADAYAALQTRLGFRTLVNMFVQACEAGVDAVDDCPPELDAFISAMEEVPDWIDMDLVEEGARIERNDFAHLVPFAIRGAFLATFINRYSALPMTLTGNLTDEKAAKRVQETATFFTLTVMPGALKRKGAAFKAAAMVRLMHAMVRFNVMRHEGLWDAGVYGAPIPQVDQMPAGQFGSLLIANKVLAEGRKDFTRKERARIEIARYRCFLLGLPRDLVGETPEEIIRLIVARQATLRESYDDAICGPLVRGTLETELARDATPMGVIEQRLERSFSRAFFVTQLLQGDTARAKAMGVDYTFLDRKLALTSAVRIYSQLFVFQQLARIPGIRDIADRELVRRLNKLLKRYGHAEFTSNGEDYHARAA